MANKPKYGAYEHNAKTHRKRKGRHSKRPNKHSTKKKGTGR